MAETDPLEPRALRAPHGATEMEITWGDGRKYAYPHRILRGYCPCAGCQGHGGSIDFQVPGNLELREIEKVGNYALSLVWADGHGSGIYSFRFLRRLGDLLDEHGAAGLEALGTLPRI